MSEQTKDIELYGKCVNDFDVSPFESIDMLYRRSALDQIFDELNLEERMNLMSYDVQLINNAKKCPITWLRFTIFHYQMNLSISGGGI
ncbi:hypothetical protein [Paenibacillus polymyxa]|uniref:hypothetical protein n=1 Tax=Paenibacillus polymyxa TaxID=1406 RepID=UPI0023792A33|nr:hypothetical protein [Paenibacillus polymyxa]